jgi:hypothetical protein
MPRPASAQTGKLVWADAGLGWYMARFQRFGMDAERG